MEITVTSASSVIATASTSQPKESDLMTEAEAALTAVTLEADRFATVYLSLLLLPLMLAFTANSLVNEKHLSWYSWAIGVCMCVCRTMEDF